MPRRHPPRPPTPHRNISCEQKRRFATQREAVAAAEYRMALKPELTLTTYRCPLCSGWHLTSLVRSDDVY